MKPATFSPRSSSRELRHLMCAIRIHGRISIFPFSSVFLYSNNVSVEQRVRITCTCLKRVLKRDTAGKESLLYFAPFSTRQHLKLELGSKNKRPFPKATTTLTAQSTCHNQPYFYRHQRKAAFSFQVNRDTSNVRFVCFSLVT